jgi:hypothetical protein
MAELPTQKVAVTKMSLLIFMAYTPGDLCPPLKQRAGAKSLLKRAETQTQHCVSPVHGASQI